MFLAGLQKMASNNILQTARVYSATNWGHPRTHHSQHVKFGIVILARGALLLAALDCLLRTSGKPRFSPRFFLSSPVETDQKHKIIGFYISGAFVHARFHPSACLLPILWTRYFEHKWTDLLQTSTSNQRDWGWNDQFCVSRGQRSRSHNADVRDLEACMVEVEYIFLVWIFMRDADTERRYRPRVVTLVGRWLVKFVNCA